MSVVIGYRYLENLTKIKNVFNNAINGRYIKEESPIICENIIGGRCYFDRCFDKTLPSDIGVLILKNDGSYTSYAFHKNCFENLLTDERFEGMN